MMRRTLPVLICFVVGILALVQYYVPAELSQDYLKHGSNWGKVIIGFSYLIGLQSLLHLHWSRIRRGLPGYGYSVLVFVGFLPMVIFGLAGEVEKLGEIIVGRDLGFAQFQAYDPDGTGAWYGWLFKNVYTPAASTMFSLLAFFIASAAFRTFRAKTPESALLLIAAVVVIFGRVPLSGVIHPWFPEAADWIMTYPNMAVKRGIMIGVSLGIVGTALRVIFGLERAYVGGE